MLKIIKKEFQAQIAVVIFVFFILWWLILQLTSLGENNFYLELFSGSYGLMALWGGLCGIMIFRKWGGFRSIFGRAVFSFSFGLLLQEFGQLAYSIYTLIFHIEIPYPSLGDLGYFGSIPFYIYGVILLAKASGIKLSLRSLKNKIGAVIIPLGLLLFSYYVFLRRYEFDWSMPMVVFLDFGYPLGQSIYLSLAILAFLLSKRILGGIMKSRIIWFLFSLFVQYLSDYVFLYKFNQGTWQTGGFNELMYLFSYLLMSLSLIQLKTTYDEIKSAIAGK